MIGVGENMLKCGFPRCGFCRCSFFKSASNWPPISSILCIITALSKTFTHRPKNCPPWRRFHRPRGISQLLIKQSVSIPQYQLHLRQIVLLFLQFVRSLLCTKLYQNIRDSVYHHSSGSRFVLQTLV